MRTRLALRLYRILLAFYPRAYRAEFAEEMEAVFAQELAEHHVAPISLFWRELRDWPKLIWRAHCEARTKLRSTGPDQLQPVIPLQQMVARSWDDAPAVRGPSCSIR